MQDFKFHNNTDQSISFGGIFSPSVTIPKYKAMMFSISDSAPLAIYSKMNSYKKIYNSANEFIKSMNTIYTMLKSSIGRVGFSVSSSDFESAKFITINNTYKNTMIVGESQELSFETNLDNAKLASTNKEVISIAKNNSKKIIARSVGECDIYAGNNTTNAKIHIVVVENPTKKSEEKKESSSESVEEPTKEEVKKEG